MRAQVDVILHMFNMFVPGNKSIWQADMHTFLVTQPAGVSSFIVRPLHILDIDPTLSLYSSALYKKEKLIYS